MTPEDVVVGSDQVQVSGVDVIVTGSSATSVTREIQYVIVTNVDTVIKYTFGLYRDTTWKDFVSFDSTGVDAPAYLVTGYLSGGDFQRRKQIPYMNVYFNQTEDGFEEDINGDFVPTNQSSCKIQTQWDWTDSVDSNRWSPEFQAYRLNRLYFPS